MTTISDFRSLARALYGTDPTSDRGFIDSVLDRTIKQAVDEFSQYLPAKAVATFAINGGGATPRQFSVSGTLTRPLRVVAIEYPLGQWPRALLDFDVWGDTVTLDHNPPGDWYSVNVYYDQRHLVDGAGSTIEPGHEHLIAEGAFCYSMFARTIGAANTFDTAAGGTPMPQTFQHLRIAEARLANWRRQLRRVAGQLQARGLYPAATHAASRDSVQPL
jgi:hypothetical protein